MSNLVPSPPEQSNPFAKMPQHGAGMNVGAVAIEQERAIAETQGKLVLAKRFPRDIDEAEKEIVRAAKHKELAESAFYAVPRGNSTVTGPSIRLAEEIARCWGNVDYGHRELSRSEGKSEVEVYAWDMQTNTSSRRQITINHILDTRSGPRKLTSEKDVDDLIANKASKQLRGRILAIMPKWLVQIAQDECRRTLEAGNGNPVAERIPLMIAAFKKINVSESDLVTYLTHPSADTSAEELADLQGIFTSIKEGHTKADEWFGAKADGQPDANAPEQEAINDVVKQQQAKPASSKRSAQPEPDPATPSTPAPRQAKNKSTMAKDKGPETSQVTGQDDSNDQPDPESHSDGDASANDQQPDHPAPTDDGDIF